MLAEGSVSTVSFSVEEACQTFHIFSDIKELRNNRFDCLICMGLVKNTTVRHSPWGHKSWTRLSALSHPRDPATYTTKTKHPPMTLAPLFQSLPGGNSGTCPQRSQTTYIRFCYVPYITLSCPKEDIFS